MARIQFTFDPDFDANVYHASNKTRSSLRPLYDRVRAITDAISKQAKSDIEGEWYRAESQATANRNKRFGNDKNTFLEAKARSFALRSAAQTIRPTMGVDTEIFGRVSINRTGSTALEYGGIDVKAEIGKGTGNYLVHPAYAFLRNAMRKAAT